MRMQLAEGVELDLYNLHADAGYCDLNALEVLVSLI